MLLWVILSCLTAIVLLILLRPLAAGREAEPAREAFDAAVYRDQLREIDSDRARGLIGEAEAEAARIEIARRLLATDSRERRQGQDRSRSAVRATMLAVAVALPLGALGVYLLYGSPYLPDQPLAARLTDPASEQNLAALVARVEARLRAHPEEGEGWDVIAPVYMGWRRYGDAADAYGRAIRLLGQSAKRLSGLGQALVLETGGVVTEEARGALERALVLDPKLVEPRILIAVAKEQDGQYAAAIADWQALLAKEGGDEAWREMVRKRIAQAEAHLAGKHAKREGPAQVAEDSPSKREPSAADVTAAENLSAADRQAMVENMVQRLATRLEQHGDDLDGWLRLVRAYSVLGRKDEALKALARAKGQFAGNVKARKQLDALAAELGLKS